MIKTCVIRLTRYASWATVIIASALLIIVPLLWPLLTSLKTEREILSPNPSFIPRDPTLENYRRVVDDGAVQALTNSALVAVGATVVALVAGCLAGYAMSRLPFRGKGAIQGLLAASLALPAISIIVPLQSVLLQLNLYGSKTGLVLAYAAMSVPFVIWIFQAHFNTIPRQLDQAAQIDGYGRMSTLYRVLLPGLRPAVMMGAIFVVLAAWNDYIIAAALVNSPSQRTIQVALAFYEGTNAREWGPLMAGVCLALAPPLLLFVIYRNVLMDGLARGALKE